MHEKLVSRPDLAVMSIIILLIGTGGNILSLIVLCRKRLREKSIGLYLIALCISDLLVLYIVLFNSFLRFAGLYDNNYQKYNCQIIRFFRVLAIDCSSWITVVITVQRTIAVYRPLNTYLGSRSRYTTPIKVLTIVFVLLVTITAIYSSSYRLDNRSCKSPHKIVRVILFSTVYSFLPAIILIVCNVAIVMKIYRRPAVGQTPHPAHNSAQTVRLVMAINIMFLICTLPASIVYTFPVIVGTDWRTNILLLSIIMSSNNAFNFVLYIVAGQSFRDELRSMFTSKKKRNIFTISNEIELQSNSSQLK